MLRLGLRTVLSHRLRFVLCTVSVVLGVAFVAGSLIFADTLSTAIRRNFAVATADLVVTPVSALGGSPQNLGDTNARPPTVSADLATRIEALPEVAVTDPHLLLGGVQLLDKSGRPVETYGVPTFGASWPRYTETAAFQLLEGGAPWGPDEVALDQRTARRVGYALGDELKVVTPTGTVTVRLTGTISPGLSGVAAGAPLVAFDGATAQLVLLGEPGWTSIGVAVKPGQDVAAVSARIRELGGDGVRVQTGEQVRASGESAVDEAFGGLSAVLLMFAALALFVSTFLIVNTFSMLVAQRARELALLRAVGASRGQVTRTVLAEALVVGAVGSTLGLLFGAGVAALLQVVLRRLDLDVPTAPVQIGAGVVITSYVVGIGVTCAAALPAARRAGRVPPVAAMRHEVALPERSLRFRLTAGLLLIAMAATGYTVSIQARGLSAALLIGLTAGLALIGVVLAGPLIGRYAVRVLTVPFGRGTPALLGRRNAERNPRRTSATAAALMISLALISGLAVVAGSAKASIDQAVTEAIGTSDLLVSESGVPISGKVTGLVADVDGVARVSRSRLMAGQVGEEQVSVAGVDRSVLDGPVVTKVEEGSLDGLAAGQAVLPRPVAGALGLRNGSSFTLVTSTGRYNLRVAAIVAANRQLDGVVVSLDTFREVGGRTTTDSVLYVDLEPGPTASQVQQRIIGALTDYPGVQVRDQQAFAAAQRAPVDVLRTVLVMLLALAILIAVLGIVNTLALGVVERTREIGLLRAIGMDRGQLRRMVQIESIAIALLGALLGAGIGTFFGAAVQTVMSEDGMAVRDIPVLQLVGSVLVAAVVGVLAAAWPARRAARLDVLRAIGAE